MAPSQRQTKTQRALLRSIHQRADQLAPLSDKQLRDAADTLRMQFCASTRHPTEEKIAALALAKEAIRRSTGLTLFDVQLLAADALIEGNVAEMQTGEGKTLSAVPAAIHAGLQGRGIHIATPNAYLAQRDHETTRPIYESLGLISERLIEKADFSEKQTTYHADITYGAGHEFGFDYLRDQTILKKRQHLPLGHQLQTELASPQPLPPITQQRGLPFAIVDEADDVLIDDASSPLVLSEYQPGDAEDAEAVRLARQLALTLLPEHDYQEDGPFQIRLTDQGRTKIHAPEVPIPVAQLHRSWACYVETALRAEKHFHRDVHYVIIDDEVQIVDRSTGRIYEDRSWQDGLHQAVEAKSNLPISPEKKTLAQITRQRFFRLYRHLAGMTGTAIGCEPEFQSVYQLGVVTIPLRQPSRRLLAPMRTFAHAEQKWNAITQSIIEHHRQGRPVLIGTRSIEKSHLLADLLRKANLAFQLLNGIQDADEAEIVAQAGQGGAITIATNLAGRGTDIKLGPGVAEKGGLHVIVSECHELARVDRQLVGRSGRQGNPGSAQKFLAPSDWILRDDAQWLATSIERMAGRTGECSIDFTPRIEKLQHQFERIQRAARQAMLEKEKQLASHLKIA